MRIILPADTVIVWTTDNWKRSNESKANHVDDLNLWFLDLPTAELTGKSQVEFTFFWTREKQWEGRNFALKSSRTQLATNLLQRNRLKAFR